MIRPRDPSGDCALRLSIRMSQVSKLDRLSRIIVKLYASHGVNRANSREQVVHIRLHVSISHVNLLSTSSSFEMFPFSIDTLWIIVTPFTKRLAEVLSRSHMFRLNLLGEFYVLFTYKTHGLGDILFSIKVSATVDRCMVIVVDFLL